MYYILIEGKPVKVDYATFIAWKVRHTQECIITKTSIGNINVSTVFTGMNANYFDNESVLCFETMVFGLDGENKRIWATIEEAKAGHSKIVARIMNNDSSPLDFD